MIKRFQIDVQKNERGQVSIVVPFDPSEVWGKKPRHFVKGTINGAAFRGSLGARGGNFILPINKDLQAHAKVGPGDRVSVVMEQDVGESADLPDDLSRALGQSREARAFLETLSPFYRNTYVKWILAAKKPETRASRIDQTISLLEQHQKQR